MDAPARHRLALALAGRCPGCAEPSPGAGLLSEGPCPRCGTVLGAGGLRGRPGASPGDGEASEPSPAALLVEEFRVASAERMGLSLLAVAAVGFLVGWMPVAGALLLVVGLGHFRLRVIAPGLLFLSARRRTVARWTMRLLTASLALTAVVGTFLASLTGAGAPVTAVVAPLTIGLSWIGGRAYLLWQIDREHARRPVALGEVFLLLGSVFGLMLSAVAVAALAAAGLALIQRLIAAVVQWL